jgi:hypothetical protein
MADECPLQESAYSHGNDDMVCNAWIGFARANVEDEVGFRCCAD